MRAALRSARQVVPLFVLDPQLLQAGRMSRARLAYLADALADTDRALQARGARLIIRQGDPAEIVPAVAREPGADAVHLHRDHTPYAARRDAAVARALDSHEYHRRGALAYLAAWDVHHAKVFGR